MLKSIHGNWCERAWRYIMETVWKSYEENWTLQPVQPLGPENPSSCHDKASLSGRDHRSQAVPVFQVANILSQTHRPPQFWSQECWRNKNMQ